MIGLFKLRRRQDKAQIAASTEAERRLFRLRCDVDSVIDLMPAMTMAEVSTMLRAASARASGRPGPFYPRVDRDAAEDALIRAVQDLDELAKNPGKPRG
jgi:hypothetical protein